MKAMFETDNLANMHARTNLHMRVWQWLEKPEAFGLIVPILTVLGAATTLLAPMILDAAAFGAFALLTSLFQYASAADMGLSQLADRHLTGTVRASSGEILQARSLNA